jgi:hypothetical protein
MICYFLAATPGEPPPFQIGHCHALRFDGLAVREHYPQWVDYTPANRQDVRNKRVNRRLPLAAGARHEREPMPSHSANIEKAISQHSKTGIDAISGSGT